MTLLEIMIVLAVIGSVTALGISMVRRVTSADLRKQAAEVAAVLKTTYNMATQSGMHHRVLFDLDEQTFRIEACEDHLKIRKDDDDEEDEVDPEDLARLLERRPTSDRAKEILEAATPEEAVHQAAALEGTRIGAARCRVPERPTGDADGRGAVRKVATGLGVKIGQIHVQHKDKPVVDGSVSINFFPLGYAEKAVIEVTAKDGTQRAVLIHRLTGRIELKRDKYDADLHMRRDVAGKREDKR